MDQETIRLLDDLDPGECVEVEYLDSGDRLRLAIGEYSHLSRDSVGEWSLFLRKRFVGVRLIDVIRIERVQTKASK